jgi:hypothetical protein
MIKTNSNKNNFDGIDNEDVYEEIVDDDNKEAEVMTRV